MKFQKVSEFALQIQTGSRNRAEVVLRNMHVAAYGVYSCLRKTSRSERRVLAEILKFF